MTVSPSTAQGLCGLMNSGVLQWELAWDDPGGPKEHPRGFRRGDGGTFGTAAGSVGVEAKTALALRTEEGHGVGTWPANLDRASKWSHQSPWGEHSLPGSLVSAR